MLHVWTRTQMLENLSHSLKVNEFASLTISDETESVSWYTGRQAQQCVEWLEELPKSFVYRLLERVIKCQVLVA